MSGYVANTQAYKYKLKLKSLKLHDEMLDRGLVPDDRTYDILVTGKVKGDESMVEASCRV